MDKEFSTYESINNFVNNGNFIYIIYSEYGCKIGFSRSPNDRLEQIKQGLPSQKAFIIGLYYGDKSIEYERLLHRKFKNLSISGEWFYLQEADLEEIYIYMLENNFICFIRLSIIWANYLLPSIYVLGKVQVIEKIKNVKPKNKMNKLIIDIPDIFVKHIKKPDILDSENPNTNFVTPTEIAQFIQTKGIKLSPEFIGTILRRLGFERVSKKILGKGARYGYNAIIINYMGYPFISRVDF